ncbi:MAG: TIGR01212 family radical SAM protein [Candidatus Omnitrophica bacterium]|nr:TIGR01212 family radical SAM protein [Candidatus Omnitrophota bacterium]
MRPYYKFSEYLKERFGCRVHKITVDAGFNCPNTDGTFSKDGCIFCDNCAFSPSVRGKNIPIERQIENGMERGRRRYKAKKFIVYFQPYSNTYAPAEILKERYDAVRKFKDIAGISIGTRPDCIDAEKLAVIQAYAKEYEVWLEYGLQSIHNKTLKFINRNHTYEDFLKAVEITKNRGIKICAHVILGLPGETKENMFETAKECSRLGLDGIKIHPLHAVKGTALGKMLNEGKYIPLKLESYMEIVSEFLCRLNPEMVIQRLTADCPEEILLAPEWINKKQFILTKIEEKMLKERLTQGCLLK